MDATSRPLRIAYVTETYPPELNGVSLTVERTVRYLRGRGHNVELIRPRQPGEARLDADDELRTAGCAIPVYRELRFGLARVGPLLLGLRAFCKRTRNLRLVCVYLEGD